MNLDITKLTSLFGDATGALNFVNGALDVIPGLAQTGLMTLEKGRDTYDSLYEMIGGLGGAPGTRKSFEDAMAEFEVLDQVDDDLTQQILGED